mgnify:FL=1
MTDAEAMNVKSERMKMLAGQLYNAADPELAAGRRRARELLRRLNLEPDPDYGNLNSRRALYEELFGAVGEDVAIEPPFYCDYGTNIYLGDRVFFNFDCVILDPAEVHIGSNVLFGPGVHIYTATHPLEAAARRAGLESAKPVYIGNDVWAGGGAIILPGVRIGDGAVIGAGAVVTKDVPPGVLAAGNPCRVIRPITTE